VNGSDGHRVLERGKGYEEMRTSVRRKRGLSSSCVSASAAEGMILTNISSTQADKSSSSSSCVRIAGHARGKSSQFGLKNTSMKARCAFVLRPEMCTLKNAGLF